MFILRNILNNRSPLSYDLNSWIVSTNTVGQDVKFQEQGTNTQTQILQLADTDIFDLQVEGCDFLKSVPQTYANGRVLISRVRALRNLKRQQNLLSITLATETNMESKPRIADAATKLNLSSAALKRLIDEVALGTASTSHGYNRTHNRHNR